MGTIRLEKMEGMPVLMAEGGLCIRDAAMLKESLVEARGTSPIVLLDLSRVESIDLACFQVLLSAHRTFRAAGGEIRSVGGISPGFESSLKDMAAGPYVNEWLFGRTA
jgi:anti-anti-sigma regulatory factor